ncbi:MAG: DUF892 family protein [Xanthobacteraceae bacterium]
MVLTDECCRPASLNRIRRLLEQTLEEEKKTDATLTKIAETVVNHRAA